MKTPSASCALDDKALLAYARDRFTAFRVPQFAATRNVSSKDNLVPLIATYTSWEPSPVQCHGSPS